MPEELTLEVETCRGCGVLLTDYEKEELTGLCGICYNEDYEARHPKHPDSGGV